MKECPSQSINNRKLAHSPLVLVIDDSNFMRNSIRKILEEIGCKVVCAMDGLEGVNLYQELQPSIVLIDAVMPIMDGFTACSLMRKMDSGKDALIYMITTHSERNFVEKAFEVGFDDYWVKPILSNVFLTRMKKIINENFKGKLKLNKNNSAQIRNELSEARKLQISLLPKSIVNDYISLSNIYSPYDYVSGDFIDYWWDDNEKVLCGYVLDATGHSIASAMQVFAIKTQFDQFFQCGKSCLSPNRILQFVNSGMFISNKRKAMATAIVFAINFKEKMMQYCSAGISPIYLTHSKVTTPGYPLGYKYDADYHTKQLSIEKVKEIIFASDGFSDLLNSERAVTEKHDDVSAIIIKILK